eukprot:2613028-Rhodomonas_salina.3
MSKTGVSQKQRWQQAVSGPKPLIDVRGSKQRTARAKQYPEEVRIKAEIAAAVSARRSLEHTDDSHRWRLENVETERYRMRKSRERNNKQMNGRSNSHTRPPQWFGLAASESEADEQSSSSESVCVLLCVPVCSFTSPCLLSSVLPLFPSLPPCPNVRPLILDGDRYCSGRSWMSASRSWSAICSASQRPGTQCHLPLRLHCDVWA